MEERELRSVVDRVREALVRAAVEGWEEAGMAGLCGEGQFEAAVGRMRAVEVGQVLGEARREGEE